LAQWRILREFMVPLIVGMLVHVAISKAASRLGGQSLRIGTYIVSNVGFLYFREEQSPCPSVFENLAC
jgi:hypothetical protein